MSELLSWERCAELCARVFAAMDWTALGEMYFHEDGEREWQQRREEVVGCGLDWARALLSRVPAAGRSLHVGAAVAEVPVLIAEVCVRGRSARAVNLRSRECDVINAALKRHQLGKRILFESVDATDVATEGGYDHLGCVSLFTDPETWPHLSDVTYGRVPPPQLDVSRFVAEREEVRALVGHLFTGLSRPGWITTTAEEVPWFLEAAARAGARIEADDELLPSAVVGDPIGFLRVTDAG